MDTRKMTKRQYRALSLILDAAETNSCTCGEDQKKSKRHGFENHDVECWVVKHWLDIEVVAAMLGKYRDSIQV